MFQQQQKHRVNAPEVQAVYHQTPCGQTMVMGNAPNYMPVNLSYPGLQRVHDQPPIYYCHDFLSHQECDLLIATAGPLLQRSKTHAVAGSEATKGRTSLTCHLAKNTQPCPLLLKKIQLLTNKPYGHMELPQVAPRPRPDLALALALLPLSLPPQRAPEPSPHPGGALHGLAAVRRALRRRRPAHGRRARRCPGLNPEPSPSPNPNPDPNRNPSRSPSPSPNPSPNPRIRVARARPRPVPAPRPPPAASAWPHAGAPSARTAASASPRCACT